MTVTIKDVAREANVSVATVSRALNGQQNVAEAVRRRVKHVAERLRYTPHHAARSLSSRLTRTIGVVLPELYGEFFSELIFGIDQVAREHGLHLLVSSYHGDPREQGDALRSMRGRVDGLLVMSPYEDADGHLADALAVLPDAVTISSHPGVAGRHRVGIDNQAGARAMVAHLAGLGHRRIAFIAGPEGNHEAGKRLLGYLDAMRELLPDVVPQVLPGDFREASGERAARDLLASGLPDAVFAANDMMALGCLLAFNAAGRSVPGDVALAGFDDVPLARHVPPGLTTMRVDIAALGSDAMHALLQGGTVATLREPRLVVRASCGARASPNSS
ncbi:MAG: LacI family DNA-binding transcriptional regulator [Thermomonas sp.]|uniref:LacI family DNA-binding transcriptional regulator n=1 Tax=Thermomonas sp. TaxID=1971895 RepID=UPI0039E481D8